MQVNFLLSSAGRVNASISTPTDPFLVGLVARKQRASIELDPQLAITGRASTNAVDVTIDLF